METQQSYKFLTDLGLAQYDATVRQYMEQTFAKKGETPGGSGVNVFDVTLGYDSEKGGLYIESFETQPEQIWESVNQDGFCVLRATLVQNINNYDEPAPESQDVDEEEAQVQGIAQGVAMEEVQGDKAESQPSTIVDYFVLSGYYDKGVKGREMIFTSYIDGQSWHIELYNGGEVWEYDIYPDEASSIIEISWNELKDLRDNGELVPGQEYCIMDYECTTNQCSQHNSNLPDTSSAHHSFGIIVKADSPNTLNENARARKECGNLDGYFDNSKLEAWKLKYCLDNDTKRFPWADGGKITVTIDDKATMFYFDKITSKGTYKWVNSSYPSNPIYTTTKNPDNSTRLYSDSQCQYDWNYMGYPGSISNVYEEGTGVIYWMQDEWGNEAPYDFKNILFSGIYTFSSYVIGTGEIVDGSLTGVNFATNIIKVWTNNGIPRNIFYGFHNPNQMANCGGWWDNQLGEDCTNNIFGDNSSNPCSGYGNRIGRGCTGIVFNRNCSNNNIGNNVETITFGNACQANTIKDNCSNITFIDYTRHVTAYEGTNGNGLDVKPNVDYPQFIGTPKDAAGNPKIITFGEGGYKPVSVAVKIDRYYNIQSVSSSRNAIYEAMSADQPIFMHVFQGTSKRQILFLELTKITNNQAIFGGWIDGEYHQCIIGNDLSQCSYNVIDEFGRITALINNLDERVTALEGDTPDQYDVTLTYEGVEVPATIEITGEEPIRASGTTWTAQIVECNDFPELVGVELTGTGSDIENTWFTGYDADGNPIVANIKQYPKYNVAISNKTTGVDSSCIAELINTRQDKTEGWLYDMRTDKCDEYPELVRDGFILKNSKGDKIDEAHCEFTTDKGEELYLSIVIK